MFKCGRLSVSVVLSLLCSTLAGCYEEERADFADADEVREPDERREPEGLGVAVHSLDEEIASDGGSSEPLASADLILADLACGPTFGADVNCDFAARPPGTPVARLSGQLMVSDREDGALAHGSLTLSTMLVGDAASLTERTVTVRGNLGSWGFTGSGVSGSGSLAARLFTLPESEGGSVSTVVIDSTTTYDTSCGSGLQTQLPDGSDLVILASPPVEFMPGTGSSWTLRVPIMNRGTAPIVLGTKRLHVNLRRHSNRPGFVMYPEEFAATRVEAFVGGTYTAATTLEPGQYARAELTIRERSFWRCKPIEIQIDSRRDLQASPFDPFVNDTKTVPAPCLSWETPLTAAAIGSKLIYDSIPADIRERIKTKSLQNIVSSEVVARPDGQLCSNCHNRTNSFPYRPVIEPGSSAFIGTFFTIAGRSWDQLPLTGSPPGWAFLFVNRPTVTSSSTPADGHKPMFLKKIVERWIRDGMLDYPNGYAPEVRP